jgi:hypothetical protein
MMVPALFDQNIDGTEHGFDLHGHGLHVFADGYVAAYGQKVFAHPGKFIDHMFEFGLIARADGDACAVSGEFAGGDQAIKTTLSARSKALARLANCFVKCAVSRESFGGSRAKAAGIISND